MVDLPGFGDSSKPGKYTLDQTSRLAGAIYQKNQSKPGNDCRPFNGQSSGGGICLPLSPTRQKSDPYRRPFSKLATNPQLAKAFTKTLKLINGRALPETLLKKIIDTRLTAYLLARYINMYQFNRFLIDSYGMIGKRKMTRQAYVQMGLDAADFIIEQKLSNCKVPVLFIYGDSDKFTPVGHAEKIMKNVKGNFKFAVIPQAGHIVSLEKPRQTALSIRQFKVQP